MFHKGLSVVGLLILFSGSVYAKGSLDLTSEVECLALNIYHEARNEPALGQYAVGFVTLNRVADRHHPDTVCEVVWEKRWSSQRERYVAQFSWTLDGKPDTPYEKSAWAKAYSIALEVYFDEIVNPIGDSKFYHVSSITPYWSKEMTRLKTIGRHVFYN